MYLGLSNLGLTGLANQFSPTNLFTNGEGGAHFETYDPQTLLRRRNQLTYSSKFSNPAWGQTNILSVTENADGVGDLVVPNTTAGLHEVHQGLSSPGVSNSLYARVRPAGYTWIALQVGSLAAYFNLTGAGSMGGISAGATATITPAADAPGYFDCTISGVATNANCFVFVAQDGFVTNFAGDGVSGIYLARAQLEWNTTTPSAYQDVTDWNTEYLAAAGGSVHMWQDSTRTTAVTAVEQPVGCWDDTSGNGHNATQSGSTKRPMLSARVNLLTKTEQFDDSYWTKTSATITANAALAPDGTLTADKLVEAAAAAEHFLFGANATTAAGSRNVASINVKAAERSFVQLRAYSNGATRTQINFNLTTGAISGQTGADGTAVWSAVATSAGWRVSCNFLCDAAASNGIGVFLCSSSSYATFYTGDGISGIYVWGADFRTSDDAAKNIPSYQRVNTATDYDTEGFPHYLKFDGVDDCLQTGSIDFTAFDKMTVWAGATKLSDSSAALVAELSASTTTNTGAFYIAAPKTSATGDFGAAFGGTTVIAVASAGTYTSPSTKVLTAIDDISSPSCVLRLNGTQETTSSASQGTGKFGNYSFNIASRNAASLFFSGRLTSLTVRGSLTPTDTSTISKMERYAGGLMKISF